MTIENHIHLDTDLEGAPENSPTNKYRVRLPGRRPTYECYINIKRMGDGTLVAQRLDSGGSPVIGETYEYELRVTTTQHDALKADLGKLVYFVDSIHVADGEDHADYRWQGYFDHMGPLRSMDPGLSVNYVDVRIVRNV